ncbi:MAG: hypothetical protein ACREQW_02110 [Candidatus Binatia bacterium]
MIEAKKFIKVPQSEYILFTGLCQICQESCDLAYWMPNSPQVINDGDYVEFDKSLGQRYSRALTEVVSSSGETYICDAGMFEIKGSVEVDLGFLDRKPELPIIPLAALALARGVREAAMQDHSQFFSCSLGPLNLSLGLTEVDPSYGMQLSVFERGGSASVSDVQLRFATSLVFSLNEINQSYEISSGRVRDVIVPLSSLSLGDSDPDGQAPVLSETRKAS